MEYYSYHTELESVRRKLTKLEQENKNLRIEAFQLNDFFKEAINHIYLPIVLIDKSGVIQFNNGAFVSLLDFYGTEAAKEREELRGFNIQDIVNDNIYMKIIPFVKNGVLSIDTDIEIKDFLYKITVNAVRNGEFAIVIFRMIASGNEKREELIYKLDEVIESNLSMIQKIGSLMGEEVAKNTQVLNSVIKMVSKPE